MEEKLSILFAKEGRHIRFIRLWGYDNGPIAQVYYYRDDNTPGWDSVKASVDYDESLSPLQQYDDLLVEETESGEYRWVVAFLSGEEKGRIKKASY